MNLIIFLSFLLIAVIAWNWECVTMLLVVPLGLNRKQNAIKTIGELNIHDPEGYYISQPNLKVQTEKQNSEKLELMPCEV